MASPPVLRSLTLGPAPGVPGGCVPVSPPAPSVERVYGGRSGGKGGSMKMTIAVRDNSDVCMPVLLATMRYSRRTNLASVQVSCREIYRPMTRVTMMVISAHSIVQDYHQRPLSLLNPRLHVLGVKSLQLVDRTCILATSPMMKSGQHWPVVSVVLDTFAARPLLNKLWLFTTRFMKKFL